MTVTGQLALRSKRPDGLEGYRVLAISQGDLDAGEFDSLFRQLAVGTLPSAGAGQVEQPPWITLGAHWQGEHCYLAVIRHVFTEHSDASQRRIAASACLCVSYDLVRDQAPGLSALYQQLLAHLDSIDSQQQILPQPQLVFPPPAARRQEQAHLVEAIGFDFAAAVAGLLVATPVVLVFDGPALNPMQRLDYLDALVSLLPYGSRTELGASTWAASVTRHTMRVTFSDSAGPHQQRVAWGRDLAAVLQKQPIAADYARRLGLLRAHSDDSTLRVIEALAGETRQISFTQPGDFPRLLRELDLPYAILEEVIAGTASVADVRRVFEQHRAAVLGDKQLLLLRYWLERLTAADVEVLARYWREALEPDLHRLASLYLTQADDNNLTLMLDLAAATGKLVRLMVGLIRVAGQLGAGQRVRTQTNTLLARKIGIYLFRIPDQSWSEIRSAMGVEANPLICELALLAIGTEKQPIVAPDWFSWLAGGDTTLQALLRPFAVVEALDEREVSAAELEALEQVAAHYALGLASQALRYHRLPWLAGGLGEWLIAQAGNLTEEGITHWQRIWRALSGLPDLPALVHARLDLLLLALDPDVEPSLAAQLDRSPAEFSRYVDEISRAAPALGRLQTRAVGQLVDDIIALAQTPSWEDPRSRANLVALIGELMQRLRQLLGKAQADRLSQLRLSGQLTAETPLEQVATLCAEVLCESSDSGLHIVVRALSEGDYLNSYARLNVFLDALRPQLGCIEPQRREEIVWLLHRHALHGTFGEPIQTEFRSIVEDEAMRDLQALENHLILLWDYTGNGWQQEMAHLLQRLAATYRPGQRSR